MTSLSDVIKEFKDCGIILPKIVLSDEDELYYIDESGEKFLAPDLSSGMSYSNSWLSEHLPEPTIDFEQSGNIRKADEATSLYKLICRSIVFPEFKKEILDNLSSYDFKNFASNENFVEFENIRDYLKSFEDLNSLRICSKYQDLYKCREKRYRFSLKKRLQSTIRSD